jgi:transcriptional regulator with XRE-family HTH domain
LNQPIPSFGAWVKSRRLALGLTQSALGERACCSGHAVRKIEAGLRRPSGPLARRLALQLNIAEPDLAGFVAAARIGHALADGGDAAPGPAGASDVAAALVGREAELALLRRWLAVLPCSQGRLVLIRGGPRVGKTALLAELARQAVQLGMPAIAAGCTPLEAGLPYALLMQVLSAGAARADAAVLASLHPELRAEIACLLPGLSDRLAPLPRIEASLSGLRRARLASAAVELLAALARRRSLVVTVDDLQWIDLASARVVAQLARVLPRLPILVMAAATQGPRPPATRVCQLLALAETLSKANGIELGHWSAGHGTGR